MVFMTGKISKYSQSGRNYESMCRIFNICRKKGKRLTRKWQTLKMNVEILLAGSHTLCESSLHPK